MVHSGRFGGATTLARAVVEMSSSPGVVIAHVLDPGPATTEGAYWTLLDETLRNSLPPPPPPRTTGAPDIAFSSVLDSLAGQTGRCVLVLDDLHLVSDPVARVDELLARAPTGGLRIVATTRTAGGWPLRLARAPDQKLIFPDSLRFDPDEVAALLRSTRTEFDVRSPEIIHQHTAGLACLVNAVCASVPVNELTTPTHLGEHAKAAIDREVDRILITDAALRDHRLHVLLAAAAAPLTSDSAMPLLGERGDPGAFLTLLGRSGLASSGGSPADPEWQFPDPVRASLMRIATRENADDLQRYRRVLARRWLDLDKPDRALRVAAEVPDWALAVQILRDNLATLYTRAYATTMSEEILPRIPEVYLRDDPALLRLRTVHSQFSAPRDVAGAPPRRRATGDRAAVADLPRDPHGPVARIVDPAERAMTFIRVVELRVAGHFDASARLCDALAGLPFPDLESMTDDDRDARGFTYAHLGISYLLVGRFADASAMMRRAGRIAVQPFIHRDVAGKSALVSAVLGSPAQARTHLAEERRHPALPPTTEALVRPAGDVAAALVALEELDSVTALRVLQNHGEPDEREEFWGFVLYAWGQLLLANGAPAQGLRYLATQVPRFATMQGNGAVVGPMLDALRADLHLACGQTAAAVDAVAASTHPLTAATRGRIALLRDEPGRALDLAREGIADPRTSTRHTLELELVAAAATLASGDRAAARRHLTAATDIYAMTGLRLPFRSLPGHVMGRLATLGRELPAVPGAPRPEFGTLTFAPAIEPAVDDTQRGPGPPLLAPLTDREHAVLRALATGATIRQIAARDFLSTNTIKSQVRAVYRKLGVSTRADALRVARGASLI